MLFGSANRERSRIAKPAIVRIRAAMGEGLDVCGDVQTRVLVPWWWIYVRASSGELVASYGAQTLREAIRYMRAGGLC